MRELRRIVRSGTSMRSRASMSALIMPTPGPCLQSAFERQTAFALLQWDHTVLTARLEGPNIGEREATVLLREILSTIETIAHGLRVLVLDLEQVQSISSMGLSMCLSVRHAAHELGARTVISGLHPDLGGLARMMRLHRLCKIVRDETELRRAIAA